MAEAEKKSTATASPGDRFHTILPRDMQIDFVGKRRFFLIGSSILNILAVVLFFVMPLNYGVDFTGGTAIRLRFVDPTTATALQPERRAG